MSGDLLQCVDQKSLQTVSYEAANNVPLLNVAACPATVNG